MSTLVKRLTIVPYEGEFPISYHPAYCVDVPHTVPIYTVTFYTDPYGDLVPLLIPAGTQIVTTHTCFVEEVAVPSTLAMGAGDTHNRGWNGGASSIASLTGDGIYSFTVPPTVAGVITGFNSGRDEGAGYLEVEYGLYFSGGRVWVIEAGALRSTPIWNTVGSTFYITRESGVIRYWVNDNAYTGFRPIYTSELVNTGTLFIDASLYLGNDQIVEADLSDTLPPSLNDTLGSAHGTFALQGYAADYNHVTASGTLGTFHGLASGVTGYLGNQTLPPGHLLPGVHARSIALTGATSYAEIGCISIANSYALTGTAGGHNGARSGSNIIKLVGEANADPPTYGCGYIGPLVTVSYGGTSSIINYANGAITLTGTVYGGNVKAVVEGSFTLTGDAGANLLTPQYAYADGYTALAGFSYASIRGLVSAAGSFTLQGYAADYNHRTAQGSFTLVGFAMDSVVYQQRGTIVATLPRLQGHSVGDAQNTPDTLIGMRGRHSGNYPFTGRGGGAIAEELPNLTQSGGTGTLQILGRIDVTLPKLTTLASGTLTNLGQIAVTLGSGNSLISSYETLAYGGGAIVKNLTMLVDSGTGSTTGGGYAGTVSLIGRIVADLPRLTGYAHGYTENTGSIVAELPALVVVPSGVIRANLPKLTGIAHGYNEIEVTYEGFSITLRTGDQGLETLTTAVLSCPFEQIVRFGSFYLGATVDGLFEIGGDTLDNEPILADVRLAPDDFDTGALKRPIALHLAGRIETNLYVSLSPGEERWLEAQPTRRNGHATARNHRAKLQRGIEARYFAYALTNPDGGDFELDEAIAENDILRRTLGGRT